MAYIKAISYYLPEKVMTNEELVKEFPEWSVDKVAQKVGVDSRHLASKAETAGDMAENAAKRLFENNNIGPADIDFVILCTQSPDYFLPSTACVLQHKLGIPTSAGAFDFNLGCSGFIYGLAVAKGLVAGGIAKNVLLLTSETYNKYLHPKDKSGRSIFGDGAAACLVSTAGFAEICEFSLGTDGAGAENLIVKSGASRYPEMINDLAFDDNANPKSSDYLFMNGPAIFNFTLKVVPPMVDELLAKNGIKKDELDLYVLHQANSYMLSFLKKKLKIEDEKFFVNLSTCGNTVSSTIPIALSDVMEQDKLHGNILLAGFGVGLSWGGVILKCK